MTAPGRYCMPRGTCYCGTCPQFLAVRRPVPRFRSPDPIRRYPKVTTPSAIQQMVTAYEPEPVQYPRLPEEYERRDDYEGLKGEILDLIANDIETQPRNLQKEIGPSEVGSPCPRKVAYGLLQMPKLNPVAPPNWKAYVGQGVHTMLERALDRYNMNFEAHIGHAERFYVETRLQVGELAGRPLFGHCDVYDRVTATAIDWKTNGPTLLKHYKANGPGPTYRSQIHLYGRGWAHYLKLPVDRVMIVFLPRQGELSDAHVWHEPYDEQVALDALSRGNGIWAALQALGPEKGLAAVPGVEDYCSTCDWFVPGEASGNFLNGCPGQLTVQRPAAPLTLEGKPAA